MFDIAFSEITLIAVVALIVIGPERLPKVAKTLGHMFGRLQRYVNEVKADINREMELDELRKLKSEVQSAAQGLHDSVTQAAQEVESGVRSVEAQINANEVAAGTAAAGDSTAIAATVAAPPAAETSAPPASPAAPADAEPPRQAALPGLERI
jgi:sec-independent protein translocase protein TatB